MLDSQKETNRNIKTRFKRQTSHAPTNANEREQQIFFITIKFGPCKGRRLKRAFKHVSLVSHVHIYIFFVTFENAIDNKCVAINSQLHKELTR